MTLPSFVFALLVALLYGAVYHFLRGGGGWRWVSYLGASLLGFISGHFFGNWQGWYLFMLGSLNLGMGTLGSVLFLIAADWLGRIDVKRESSV